MGWTTASIPNNSHLLRLRPRRLGGRSRMSRNSRCHLCMRKMSTLIPARGSIPHETIKRRNGVSDIAIGSVVRVVMHMAIGMNRRCSRAVKVLLGLLVRVTQRYGARNRCPAVGSRVTVPATAVAMRVRRVRTVTDSRHRRCCRQCAFLLRKLQWQM